MTQEALKLALEALEKINEAMPFPVGSQAITAIKEALRENAMREVQRLGQEIEQEPVAYWKEHAQGLQRDYDSLLADYEKLAQRPRVVFPTMLRKMWSGSEVQAWLDENVNKENT